MKYGVTCDRAQLSNGTPICSILDIPGNTKVLHLISEDEISKEYVEEGSQVSFEEEMEAEETRREDSTRYPSNKISQTDLNSKRRKNFIFQQ